MGFMIVQLCKWHLGLHDARVVCSVQVFITRVAHCKPKLWPASTYVKLSKVTNRGSSVSTVIRTTGVQ